MNLLKTFYCCLSILASVNSYCQPGMTITAAELKFAQQAREENMKAAFLSNLDSNGVVFNRGKVINGLHYWQRAPENGPRLLWLPALSLTSAKGDLGFTTGPFELRDSLAGTVLTCGQYTSVWKRNAKMEWKLLADLGTGYTPTAYPAQVLAPFQLALLPDTAMVDLYQLEANLNYAAILYPQSILSREGKQPLQSAGIVLQELTTLPANIEYMPLAAGIAQSNDLGYVYGQVKAGNKTANYVRIWVHTAKGWVVLLQAIGL